MGCITSNLMFGPFDTKCVQGWPQTIAKWANDLFFYVWVYRNLYEIYS